MDLKELFLNVDNYIDKEISISGWIKNHRKQKDFGFIDFNDGTYFQNMQVVYNSDLDSFDEIVKLKLGSAVCITGKVVKSTGKGQNYEIILSSVDLLGDCAEDYPMQPKRHTMEFLRSQAYLRPRMNMFSAAFRIRSVASMAVHTYFQDRDYVYFHAPIITGSDCEGAGEMFKVTTFDKLDDDYSNDFFGKQVGLTVTGQLQCESFALAFKKAYTFGPTFRAENSNTKVHASEFWMVEPEIAFCDLNENMNIMEDMLKYVVKYVLDRCGLELEFFDKFVSEGLLYKLNNLLDSDFIRIDHKDVIDILINSGVSFEFEPKQGEDISKEHEKYIVEHFGGPVFIQNWPKDIKAFYMKLNDDNETVAAVDLIVPGSGELMGGSQREDDYSKLVSRMEAMNISVEELYWYVNLRKYGGCVHSGFGMGFERLLMYLTGISNIRDVTAFPRTPGNCEF